MTLRKYHSEILKNYTGVKLNDPQNDTLFRDKILQKLNYFIDTSKDTNIVDTYNWCKSEIDKRSKEIADIYKQTESKIAENEVMLKQSANDRSDETYYKNAIRVLQNFLTYLKEK